MQLPEGVRLVDRTARRYVPVPVQRILPVDVQSQTRSGECTKTTTTICVQISRISDDALTHTVCLCYNKSHVYRTRYARCILIGGVLGSYELQIRKRAALNFKVSGQARASANTTRNRIERHNGDKCNGLARIGLNACCFQNSKVARFRTTYGKFFGSHTKSRIVH